MLEGGGCSGVVPGEEDMISLKRYLDNDLALAESAEEAGTLAETLSAYGSAMLAMGNYSLEACPGLGTGLKEQLGRLQTQLSPAITRQGVQLTDRAVQEQLQHWGKETARHYRERAGEVKQLLLTMARAGEAVGSRDQRCALQMSEVTARLSRIATLDDLTQIRASIECSAAELKSSIDRMTAEGKAAVEDLKKQVASYQAKLEEAEEMASRDALTGLRNRMCMASMMEARIAADAVFCVAMIDLDGFKKVNDTHGHPVGDDLLKQFAGELRSACRVTDVIGRWGGDEFLIVLDAGLGEAAAQIERMRKWVCGDYKVDGKEGALKLRLQASIGVAEHLPQESLKALMMRADAAMYERKGIARAASAA